MRSDFGASNRQTQSGRRLALGELGGAAGFVQADLFTLDFASIAGDETGFAQRGLQRFVVFDQGAGDTEADRASLAGDATAGDRYQDVELAGVVGQFERLAHDHAGGLATEELLERLAVDHDLAIALAKKHAGGGGFAAAGAVILLDRHDVARFIEKCGHGWPLSRAGTAP
jgi:hypothetical protein